MNAPRAYFSRIRLRALAWLLGIALASVATVALSGVSWIPIVFGAVAAAAVSLSKTAQRLGRPTCLECGADLSNEPVGTHGIICRHCGAVNQPQPSDLA
jgi:hypothetical protein